MTRRHHLAHAETRRQAAKAIEAGTRGMATREAQAYDAFLQVLMRQGDISREAAAKVYGVYKKHRVLNTRGVYSSGVISVKHGGFLEKDVILRALAEAVR